MIAYLLRRAMHSLLVLWVVVTITFMLMHAVPGGPFDRERAVPAAVKHAIEERYRLNDPLHLQYLYYMNGLLHFDLGPSFFSQGRSVNSIIADGFPVSALLGFLSILLSLAVGVPLGIISALRRNQWLDHLSMIAAISLVSVPSFVLCSFLIFAFANRPFSAVALPAPDMERTQLWAKRHHKRNSAPADHSCPFIVGILIGLHRPAHARQFCRGAAAGLYPHRAGEGRRHVASGLAPCLAQRHSAGGDLPWPINRHGADRQLRYRANLRDSWAGSLLCD